MFITGLQTEIEGVYYYWKCHRRCPFSVIEIGLVAVVGGFFGLSTFSLALDSLTKTVLDLSLIITIIVCLQVYTHTHKIINHVLCVRCDILT